jgi:hypothetical protein
MTLYTEDDIQEAARDLATLLAMQEDEAEPAWRAALDEEIAADTRWLAEMIEAVRGPALPIGLPAPGPVWRAGE